MKKFTVKYRYNHGLIESDMIVEAGSPEAAKEKAFQYAGVDHIISVKEEDYTEYAKVFCDAIRALAENPDRLDVLESYLSRHFDSWCKKYADPQNIAAEMKAFAEI